jgi:hypothetical protein
MASSVRLCAGTCLMAMMGGLGEVNADDNSAGEESKAEKPRSEKRIEFAEKWLTRFMDVLGKNVDEATFNRIMEGNGRACFANWMDETGQQVKQATLEEFTEWVKKNIKDDTFKVEGNIIYFQFTSAAETGEPSKPGQCLCTFAENKPAGLSPRYCRCSVGYVKEWFDRKFGKPVEVELLSSVLRGDDWCRFKITVPM